jgi:hypothetical protein
MKIKSNLCVGFISFIFSRLFRDKLLQIALWADERGGTCRDATSAYARAVEALLERQEIVKIKLTENIL